METPPTIRPNDPAWRKFVADALTTPLDLYLAVDVLPLREVLKLLADVPGKPDEQRL
jgi:hypothetical protein